MNAPIPADVSILNDFGLDYFNPLLGQTPAETCGNISDVMGFLHSVMASDADITETRQGLALIVQTVWSAAQYQGSHGRNNKPSIHPTGQN